MARRASVEEPALDGEGCYEELDVGAATFDHLIDGSCFLENGSVFRLSPRADSVDMELDDMELNASFLEQTSSQCEDSYTDCADEDEDDDIGFDDEPEGPTSRSRLQKSSLPSRLFRAGSYPQLDHPASDMSFQRSCTCSCGSFGSMSELDAGSAAFEHLDRNLRPSLHVRVVDVSTSDGHTSFQLKVEDNEAQVKWELTKTFKEMLKFYRQVRQISASNAPVRKTLWGTFRELRKFRLPKNLFSFRKQLAKQRLVAFDSFMRRLAALVSPAPVGPRRYRALLLLQDFVEVDKRSRSLSGSSKDSARTSTCTSCYLSPTRADAHDVVVSVFGDDDTALRSEHAVERECNEFVTAVTKRMRESRRSELSVRKARATLRTIARKMGELQTQMLEDKELEIQLSKSRATLSSSADTDASSNPEYDELLEEVRHEVCAYIQKRVLLPLEDHVHESLHALHPPENVVALKQKLRVLQTKPQNYFGIPSQVTSDDDWEDARRELRRIDSYTLPLDKLRCILRSASAIFRAQGAADGACDAASMSTDEFLPIFLFVVVATNMSDMLLTKELVRVMCDWHDETGEIGYYLTSFEAVVDAIQRHQNLDEPILA